MLKVMNDSVDKRYGSHEEFFGAIDDYNVKVVAWGCERSFSVEEMYQHFKERLLSELEVAEIIKDE